MTAPQLPGRRSPGPYKTVGDLRKMIDGLPDSMVVYLETDTEISHLTKSDPSDVFDPAEGPALTLIADGAE
jgi:hypothetical protein